MVPRSLLTLLAFCASIYMAAGAPTSNRSGNFDRPQAPAIVEKAITVEVLTPDGAWEVKIDEVRRVNNELWVFATVGRPEDSIGAMMISAAFDRIEGRFPDLPMKTFVVGKTWTWANKEAVQWISKSDWLSKRRQGQRLWRR